MSDLDDMALFAAVANSGGFSRAAERTGVPVATLSRRIGALEKRLGVSLLTRTTRSMQLTEAGRVYLRHCDAIVAQQAKARDALRDLQEEPVGHLVVAGSFGTDIRWGSQVLADFMQRHPGISVTAVLLNDGYDLDALEFDIAFVHGEKPDTRHHVQGVGENEMLLCASPAYLSRKGIPEGVAALDQHDLVICDRFLTGVAMPEELHTRFGRARFVCNEVITARQAAMDGCGITWMPQVMVATQLASGELLRVIPACAHSLSGWMVMSRGGVGTRKVDAFLRHFMTAALASAPWRFPQ